MLRVPSRRTVAAGITALGLLAAAAPACAISDEQACAEEGGMFVKEQGTASCQLPVGNSDNVKEVSQKGSFGSSHDEALTNPGGNKPPGQQGGNRLQ